MTDLVARVTFDIMSTIVLGSPRLLKEQFAHAKRLDRHFELM